MARLRLFAQLEARIREESQKALDDMGNCSCPDYGAYKYQCGYLMGMGEVLRMMEDIEKQKE